MTTIKLFLIIFGLFLFQSQLSFAQNQGKINLVCKPEPNRGNTIETKEDGNNEYGETYLTIKEYHFELDKNTNEALIEVISTQSDMLTRHKDIGYVVTHGNNGTTIFGKEINNSEALSQNIFWTYTIYEDGTGFTTKSTQYDKKSLYRINTKIKNFGYLFPIKCKHKEVSNNTGDESHSLDLDDLNKEQKLLALTAIKFKKCMEPVISKHASPDSIDTCVFPNKKDPEKEIMLLNMALEYYESFAKKLEVELEKNPNFPRNASDEMYFNGLKQYIANNRTLYKD